MNFLIFLNKLKKSSHVIVFSFLSCIFLNQNVKINSLPLPFGFAFKPYIGLDSTVGIDYGDISENGMSDNFLGNIGGHVGLRLHDRLGFEVGYNRMDSGLVSIAGGSSDLAARYMYYDVRLYQQIIDLFFVNIEAFLSLGVADFSSFNYQINGLRQGSSDIENGLNSKVGLGLQLKLLGATSISLAYEKIASDIDAIKLGINIYFL